jgi:hypothetical protein
LPADAGIDPAIEQQIDQHLGRPVEALNQRDDRAIGLGQVRTPEVATISVADPRAVDDSPAGHTLCRRRSRASPGKTLAGMGHAAGAHQFFDLQVEAVAEIYLEEGELER